MSAAAAPNEVIKASAREWFVAMVIERPSERTRLAFEAWRVQDEMHEEAYARYARVWSETGRLQDLAYLAAEPPSLVVDPQPARRSAAWSARSKWLAAASVAVALAVWQLQIRAPRQFSTEIGETRDVTLADGSQVALGAHSNIEVWFRGAERHVALRAGEAYFSVAHDAAKPFLIDIGHQQVRVLGTRFDVRRVGSAVRISVLEGVVQVSGSGAEGAATSSQTLHAGDQLDADTASAAVRSIRSIGSTDPLAWRKGHLVYVDAPLSEVIADANRYSAQFYVIREPALANARVSVSYATAQVGPMLAGLAQAIPFTFKQISAGQVELEADAPARP